MATADPPCEPINWAELRITAAEAAERAYAPYSGLHVGAAGRAPDGRVVSGCNVENASYGLTLCAECGVISALRRDGGHTLVALTASTPDGTILLPCGRCRQLLHEHGGPELLIDTPDGPRPLGELLPLAFGPTHLPS